MENQYNYYDQGNTNGNYQYGGPQPQPGGGRKKQGKMPKAVADGRVGFRIVKNCGRQRIFVENIKCCDIGCI